jgi:hypothetical protein
MSTALSAAAAAVSARRAQLGHRPPSGAKESMIIRGVRLVSLDERIGVIESAEAMSGKFKDGREWRLDSSVVVARHLSREVSKLRRSLTG